MNLPKPHCVVLSVLFLALEPASGFAAEPPATLPRTDLRTDSTPAQLPPEVPDDPPGVPALPVMGKTGAASTIRFGRFTHVQVNVDASGANIPGDAANEPSIAVDPRDHDRMVIGWRQFDTIASNFREAGVGFTTDGGRTWTAGTIDPGVFRSDPVLGVDRFGSFLYSSLSSGNGFVVDYFPSSDGGVTWGPPVFGYGGDKQWFTVDRTESIGRDHVYQAWSTASNPSAPNTFNRSTVGGQTFGAPSPIPGPPIWGTLDVASDGTVYVGGSTGPRGPIYVARSANARDAWSTVSFSTATVDLGGSLLTGFPNPAGLLGQLWVAVDRSAGPRAGWVYALASVTTPTDAMDVHFVRSTDGGITWSRPVRVNDDTGIGAMQWFGTMSVAPDGRIDVVWNDTRDAPDHNRSALYYAFSTDGGVTWSANEAMSRLWDSLVGFPNQSKIGDYYHMVSDSTGADLAWAATFNGEQDVYYVRIPNPSAALAHDPTRPFRLHPVVPNPFSGSATVAFDLPPGNVHARLEVFDAAGRKIATLLDGALDGGRHVTHWNGTDADRADPGSGIYFCRLQVGGASETRRMMRLRP